MMEVVSSETEEGNVETERGMEVGVREMGRVEVPERERATVVVDAEPERERAEEERERAGEETEVAATERVATTEETAGVVVRQSQQVPEEVVTVCPVSHRCV